MCGRILQLIYETPFCLVYVFKGFELNRFSSTCHERPPPVRSESGPSWQVAAGYRDINTAKTVVGTLQKWPAKAGGRSPKGPVVAGTTVVKYGRRRWCLFITLLSSQVVLSCCVYAGFRSRSNSCSRLGTTETGEPEQTTFLIQECRRVTCSQSVSIQRLRHGMNAYVVLSCQS